MMLRHRCKTTAIGVEHRNVPLSGVPQTVVLWRCPKCGSVMTSILDGKWSLEQIRTGVQPEPVHPAPARRPG